MDSLSDERLLSVSWTYLEISKLNCQWSNTRILEKTKKYFLAPSRKVPYIILTLARTRRPCFMDFIHECPFYKINIFCLSKQQAQCLLNCWVCIGTLWVLGTCLAIFGTTRTENGKESEEKRYEGKKGIGEEKSKRTGGWGGALETWTVDYAGRDGKICWRSSEFTFPLILEIIVSVFVPACLSKHVPSPRLDHFRVPMFSSKNSKPASPPFVNFVTILPPLVPVNSRTQPPLFFFLEIARFKVFARITHLFEQMLRRPMHSMCNREMTGCIMLLLSKKSWTWLYELMLHKGWRKDVECDYM